MPASSCWPTPTGRTALTKTSWGSWAPASEPFLASVTQSLQAALDRQGQPPRPDKIKIKGDVEQKLVQLACSDPPRGRCHWTLPLLADELVVLGLVHAVSTETVRQALKKTTFSPGLLRRGASRRRPTPRTSGAWKT